MINSKNKELAEKFDKEDLKPIVKVNRKKSITQEELDERRKVKVTEEKKKVEEKKKQEKIKQELAKKQKRKIRFKEKIRKYKSLLVSYITNSYLYVYNILKLLFTNILNIFTASTLICVIVILIYHLQNPENWLIILSGTVLLGAIAVINHYIN